MTQKKNGKPRAPAKTRTRKRGVVNYRESAQAAHLPRKSYYSLAQVMVPRVFMRSCRLPPAAFRVLCHGLTYPMGWSVQKCCVDAGMKPRGVRISLTRLMAMGYVVRKPNPRDRRRVAYRFFPFPQEILQEYAELDRAEEAAEPIEESKPETEETENENGGQNHHL